MEAASVFFSRIGFIFIIFTVLSSGYVSEILSCQVRYIFESNPYFRHFVCILMFFIFIMLEGGWSFDTEENNAFPNDWASGNVVDTFIMAFFLYTVFLISAKSTAFYNLTFMGLVLVLYLINTQRSYLYTRKRLSKKTNRLLLNIQYGVSISSAIVLIAGFYSYLGYQHKMHKGDFSFEKFILGSHICKSVASFARKQ